MSQQYDDWQRIREEDLVKAIGEDNWETLKERDSYARRRKRFLSKLLGCKPSSIEESCKHDLDECFVLYRQNDDLAKKRRNDRRRWNAMQVRHRREEHRVSSMFSPGPTRFLPPLRKDHPVRLRIQQRIEGGGFERLLSVRGEVWPDRNGYLIVRGGTYGVGCQLGWGFSGRIYIRTRLVNRSKTRSKDRLLPLMAKDDPIYKSQLAYACYSYECGPEEIELRGGSISGGGCHIQTIWLKYPGTKRMYQKALTK